MCLNSCFPVVVVVVGGSESLSDLRELMKFLLSGGMGSGSLRAGGAGVFHGYCLDRCLKHLEDAEVLRLEGSPAGQVGGYRCAGMVISKLVL